MLFEGQLLLGRHLPSQAASEVGRIDVSVRRTAQIGHVGKKVGRFVEIVVRNVALTPPPAITGIEPQLVLPDRTTDPNAVVPYLPHAVLVRRAAAVDETVGHLSRRELVAGVVRRAV